MKKIIILALFDFFALAVVAQTPLRLPAIISDHAVFQQNTDIKLWGWGPSTWDVKISCSWNPADTVRVEPGKDCSWNAMVKTPKAGGPYTITFISRKQKITISDILIGEVWLCSGQSNMEYAFNWGSLDADDEPAQANNNELRFFQPQHAYSNFPQENSDGQWRVCTPQSVEYMSIAAYFFGKEINQKLKVPVGLIASYWGGTSVQVWMPNEIFYRNDELKTLADKLSPVNWCPVEPSVVYNSMIYPLKNYKIAGAIWYQGEANTDYPEDYGKLFGSMINSWRKAFNNDFPFYFVQIAPWNGYGGISAALLREQQESCLSIPNTGMISVADLVDNISDIHPKIKKEVGIRLVNLALKEHYGLTNLQPYFPKLSLLKIDKNKASVSVKSYGKLICKGEEITGFQICGEDKTFYPAIAKMEKNGTITLTSKNVEFPVAVRYCFTNDSMPNLFDTNGLPLLPFRTDK